MVIVCVRNQNGGWTEAPDAAQPVLAAIDQHSTAATIDHDGGMPLMETRPRLNIPPRPEECQTHDRTPCLFAFGSRSAPSLLDAVPRHAFVCLSVFGVPSVDVVLVANVTASRIASSRLQNESREASRKMLSRHVSIDVAPFAR
jgi:hypothetical protein